MSHPIPKELKGEERYFYFKSINIYLNKKGTIYVGAAIGIATILGKMFGLITFVVVGAILVAIAYPLAQVKMPRNRFDGGNVGLDIFLYRKIRYKRLNRNVYIKRRE